MINTIYHLYVRKISRLSAVLLFQTAAIIANAQQGPSNLDRQRGHDMLRSIQSQLKTNYYDPNFHGMDVDARFDAAEEKIKQAASLGQIFGIIGQVLVDLNDSHTFFVPPGRTTRTEYGWRMQMVGDRCLVTAVKPDSDAEAKGLRAGDEVYSIDGRVPTHENLWKLNYLYNILRPQPGMRLVIIKPDGQREQIEVVARVQQTKRLKDLTGSDGGGYDIWDLIRAEENEAHLFRQRYVEFEKQLFIWKMPQFSLSKAQVDDFVDKFRHYNSLILDLRGNDGGDEETLLRLLSNLFDHDIKIGDLKRRKEQKPMTVKGRGNNAFTGKLIVLIDSESASASELFARIIQLEKRGVVIGDRSAGAVMRARQYSERLGVDIVIFYGVSITDADIIMTDGKSLEHIGVTPDDRQLPTRTDVAAKRDPVLAYAASLLGVTLTPEKAGSLFPIEWEK